jgi:streptogramin lyase
MSYTRVIPRDLFNEANLLKCLGRLWICLENNPRAILGDNDAEHGGEPFHIEQSDDDGSISVTNVPLHINGFQWRLSRPLNSREAWPLWMTSPDDETHEPVFDDNGNLSPEFLALIAD